MTDLPVIEIGQVVTLWSGTRLRVTRTWRRRAAPGRYFALGQWIGRNLNDVEFNPEDIAQTELIGGG